MSVSIDQIISDQSLVQTLAELSDIEFLSGDAQRPMYSVEGLSDLSVIAGDGAGGQFVTSPSSGNIFYFSSEGEAGMVGTDFTNFIATIVAIPFWRDALKYSGNGKLDEMRRAVEVLEEDRAEDDEAIELQESLEEKLALSSDRDFIADLHAAVTMSGTILDTWDGKTASLFGRFTIDDNPMWRQSSR